MTQAELKVWEQGWTAEMVKIWEEKIMQYRIRHTGALFNSLSGAAGERTIEHKFLMYGIYQARGSGNGYTKGNGGNLQVLDPEYRAKHNLRKTREKRPWFMKKYYRSIMVLNEFEGHFYGQAYMGALFQALTTSFEGAEIKRFGSITELGM